MIRCAQFAQLLRNITVFFILAQQRLFYLVNIYKFQEMSQRKMWDKREDNMIKDIVQENQKRSQQQKWKWSEIADILQTRIPGCKRTGKQCRQRWYNHLNPSIIHDKGLSKTEIDKLFDLQNKMGNRWALIAKQFPGRTDNNLKNFFYSSLRRAIRQINLFVAQYKKKSNIKPFKQSILTKILNINDDKYRQKLDIKNNEADRLAQSVKQMLSKLSLQQEDAQLNQPDIQFRQKVVKSIQDFNKSCKKRKSKRVEEQEEPDMEEWPQFNQHKSSQSQSQKQRKRKVTKEKKVVVKRHQQIIQKQNGKSKQGKILYTKIQKDQKIQKKQKDIKSNKFQQDKNQIKPLFQKPRITDDIPFIKRQTTNKQSQLNQQELNQIRLRKLDSKRSSSKNNSSSSGKYIFNLESSDLLKSNYVNDNQPNMINRKSSIKYQDPLGFVPTIQSRMSKRDSKYEEFPHFVPENLLESINFGDNIPKFTEGSVNESSLFKMSKIDSKIDQNTIN